MNIKKPFVIVAFAVLALSGAGFVRYEQSSFEVKAFNASDYRATQSEIADYYSSISDSLSGSELRTALNKLNSSKRKSTVGYNGMKTFAQYCDADPDGSGKILGFYDNTLVGPSWDSAKTWNREHVWPDARGGSSVEGDAHMPRPASVKANSSRGSKGFSYDSFDPGYEIEYYRGVCSRIIFYCMIANTSLKLTEDPLNYDGSSPSNTMGKLSDMLKWNIEYLPSDTSFTGKDDVARRAELQRNDVIQNHSSGQGNRNPFIDHPEYACKIWGDTNATTKSICDNAHWDNTPYVNLDKTTVSIVEEQSTTLTATSSDNSTITWTSSDSSVASISASSSSSGSAITINGLKAGTTKITAKATIEEKEYSKECTVTVTAKPVPAKVTSISIVNEPTKKQYVVGDMLDLTGLKVNAIYDKGSPVDVTSSVTASPTTLNSAGPQKITLTYTCSDGTFTDNFDVTVKESGEEIIPVVESISISKNPTKLEYEVGDELDLSGLEVLATLDDGNTKDVTLDVVADVETFEEAGEQEVTLTYTCSDGSFTAKFSVEVKEREVPPEAPTLRKIKIITQPSKLVYEYGETLDLTGLQVAAYYEDNDTVRDVTEYVEASPTELKTAGQVTITLSYTEGGVTAETTFEVNVAEPEPEPPTPPEPKPTSGCMGDIVTTSVVLSAIALAGIAFIISAKIIRKKKDR